MGNLDNSFFTAVDPMTDMPKPPEQYLTVEEAKTKKGYSAVSSFENETRKSIHLVNCPNHPNRR